MDILFFAALIAYFAATMAQAVGAALGKARFLRAALVLFALGFALRSPKAQTGLLLEIDALLEEGT